MKKILFFLFLSSISFSFSQVARVVQSKYPGKNFSSCAIAINNEYHDFHLEGSYIPTLVNQIQYNVFDDLGNLLKLEYISLPYTLDNARLTGVFQIGTNEVLLYTVSNVPQTNNVVHNIITIDITSNSFVQNTVLNLGILKRNFSPTIEVSGKLISYITIENIGLKRVEIDKFNLSLIEFETVDNYIPTWTNNNGSMGIDIKFAAGIEYIASGSTCKVYKRTGPNAYSSSSVLMSNLNSSYTQSISVSNSNIVSILGNVYTLLDLNLNTLIQDTLSNYSPQCHISSVYKNNSFYFLIKDVKTEIVRSDINLSLITRLLYTSASYSMILRLLNNKLSLSYIDFGTSFSGLGENGSYSSVIPSQNYQTVSVWFDDSMPFEGFLDLGKELKAKDYTINSGHAYSICDGSGLSLNMGAYSNDLQPKSLLWSASNMLVGYKDTSMVGAIRRFGKVSFQIGPYTDSAFYNWKLQSKYSRRFYVTKFTIADHLQHLANGTPNYVPDFGIREWPGNGNVSLGQSAKLADFYDENNNGIYEPMLGDYPKIYGDECVFTIAHTSEGTPDSPKIELHSYRFLFHCDSNEVVRNTIFQKNFYIARGLDLDSVYISNFYDMDIGNAQDDYVGTNVELGLVYGYNGYLDDQTGSTSLGWGTAPPAFGIMTLQGAKQVNDGIDNGVGIAANETINGMGYGDGLVDNENWGLTSSYMFTNGATYPYTDPNNLSQFFQVAKGNNADGSAQTFLGFPNSMGIPVHHAVLGFSDPLFYSSGGVNHGNNMSEISFGNPPGDRRIIGSSGPGELYIGDTLTSLIALIFSRDTTATTIQQPVNKLFADATILKSLFLNNNVGCGESFDPLLAYLKTDELQFQNVIIYPNPTKQKFIISGLESKTEILLVDMKGTVLLQSSTTQNQLEIDLSGFADGMYFVSLKTDKGQILKKVVKN